MIEEDEEEGGLEGGGCSTSDLDGEEDLEVKDGRWDMT